MTILPKKKSTQPKSDVGDAHGPPLTLGAVEVSTRDRYAFSSRNSPPSWPLPPSVGSTSAPFDDYENVENGASHSSKRRHRASPHRNVRKSHNNPLHSLSHRGPNSGGGVGPQAASVSVANSGGAHNSPPHERGGNSGAVTVEVSSAGQEDHKGYNSGDEYDRPSDENAEDNFEERERNFEKKMRKKGFMIKAMGEDGACLFRAVADQVYGDQDMHTSIRKLCMDYMAKNGDYYSQYITEDFDKYLERKRCDHIHGNHVEMQAMSEMFNRPIEVYHYSLEPINIFHGIQKTENEPIRLSYHRNTHYNSIIDPFKATVGVGLGLPSFKPGVAEKSLVSDAIRASEESELEQAMLEDKLRATDWEATSEAIEEQVARESYLEWMRENEVRARKKTRTATATSSSVASAAEGVSSQGGGRVSPRTRAQTPTCNSPRMEASVPLLLAEDKNDYMSSPKAGCSGTTTQNNPRTQVVPAENPPVASGSNFGGFSLIETASFMNQLPPSMFGLSDYEETDILARVLAQSQQEYLDNLKHSANNNQSVS